MSLKLEIVSEHREIVGDDAVREFRDEGGTIGRSLHNDWILPDPDRYISGKHAAIDCRGGIYYLADLSTNGVYINDDREPVGRGNPRRLFNGDRLHFGDFEIDVTIDEGEDLEMPPEPRPTVVPDNIEQLVPEDSLKTGIQLLDEEAITGDEDFVSALFSEHEPAQREPVSEPPQEAQPMPAPKRVEFTGQDLFDAFLDGLQVNRAELHPTLDLAEAMRNAGEVLREFVEGSEKLLASRANLKTAFRLDQTSILPRHNNPMKLSENTGELVKQLLVGQEGEYLGPRDAVREVCQDLLAHQDAFLDAMTAAFVDFAGHFDPEELTESFNATLGGKPRLKFLGEMKYWSLYRELYPVLIERGGGRFPQLLAEEFVKAYEQQIAESLRQNRSGGSLRDTVRLEPHQEAEFLAEMQQAENAGGSDEPADQTEQPEVNDQVSALEGIDELDNLIDFDELESQLSEDDDQAKA